MINTTSSESHSTFDPHTAFLDLRIVRYTIGIILTIVVISVTMIISHDQLHFDLTSTGFNSAANIFKVPLGAFTLAIPALALLAANHRSEQTKRQMSLTLTQIERTDQQIKIAQGQNIFSNYFKHVEEFDKRFKAKEGTAKLSVGNTHKVHAKLFPSAPSGDLSVSTENVRELEGHIESFLDACQRFRAFEDWTVTIHHIDGNMSELSSKYFLVFPPIVGTNVQHNDGQFTLIGGNVIAALEHYLSIYHYLDEVFSFDSNYRSGPMAQKVLRAKAKTRLSGRGPFEPFEFDKLFID